MIGVHCAARADNVLFLTTVLQAGDQDQPDLLVAVRHQHTAQAGSTGGTALISKLTDKA